MQVHSRLQRAASVLQGRTGQEQVTLHASEGWQEIESWGGGGGRKEDEEEGRRGGGERLRVTERRGERERRERGIEGIKRTVTLGGFWGL